MSTHGVKKMDKLRLHIGCGTRYLEDWINIDNNSDNNITRLDMNLDLRNPLPFSDNSVHYIYHEHFLEHLSVLEAVRALKDFMRVLRPNGVMRVSVPDLALVVANYGNPDWKKAPWLKQFGLGFVQTRAELININFRAWGHQWLYDWEELERRLREAGCVAIKQRKDGQSVHPDLQKIDSRGGASVIAEVTKEAAV